MPEIIVNYGLYTDDGEGGIALEDYADTREEAITWFNEELARYPNNRVQVREITYKVIANCALTPVFFD